MRLDTALSAQTGLSRNKASELIRGAQVLVNGAVITKTAFETQPGDAITVANAALQTLRVSRSAQKLAAFLDEIGLDVAHLACLDVGASTGGWSEVLLERGAKTVTAVDVGRDQLHPKLRNDTRLISVEQTDIRDFVSQTLYDLVVCDASFIPLAKIISAIDRLAMDKIIVLFKPQFEVGRAAKRDKKGVVLDAGAVRSALQAFCEETTRIGWVQKASQNAAVKGKDGNLEYLFYYAKKDH